MVVCSGTDNTHTEVMAVKALISSSYVWVKAGGLKSNTSGHFLKSYLC